MKTVRFALNIRPRKRRRTRNIVLFLLALAYFTIFLPFSLLLNHRAEVAAYDASIVHLASPQVFIATMLANCAPLLSDYWIPALLGLIDKLGPENVFVSIVENGSVDKTRNILQELERILTQRQVSYTFRYEEGFRDGVKFQSDGLLQRLLGKEGTGDSWIWTADGQWFPRRISYLAQLRNIVLDPLRESTRIFDKILFLNDVIFSV